MDTRPLSQPRLAFTDEVSANEDPQDSRRRTVISDHLWFVDDHQSRVVLFRHEVIYQAALDDKVHLRFIAATLRLNGHATQAEITRAFGHSVRAQREWETQFQQKGLQGLERKAGSGRRSHIPTSQDVLLRRWFQQGVTQKVMAQRLGVGINVVKRALARLGLRRVKTTPQKVMDWNHDASTITDVASEEHPSESAEPSDESLRSNDSAGQEELSADGAGSEAVAEDALTAPVACEGTTSTLVSMTVGGGPVVVDKVEVVNLPVIEVSDCSASNGEAAHGERGSDLDNAKQAFVAPATCEGTTGKPASVTVGGDPVVIGKVEVFNLPVIELSSRSASNGEGAHEERGSDVDDAKQAFVAPAACEGTTGKPVSVTVGGGPVVIGKVEVAKLPVSELLGRGACNGEGAHGEGGSDLDNAKQALVAKQVAMGFTIDDDPTNRSGDRTLARLGMLEDALPLFVEADHLPRAGVLLAIPLLAKSGLLDAFDRIYSRSLGPSFYGLRTLVVTLFLCALLRIRRAENLKEYAPWELGRLLGLDRAPEVKTVRGKLSRLAAMNQAKLLMDEVARMRIAADENCVAFLYVDGHVREYHGRHPLSKAKKSQRQVAQRAATDTWVHDALGEPLLVVTSELNEGLTQVLEPILAEVRPLVGERRVTVIFDRGGYSPKLFARLIKSGFDIITYRKGKSADRPRGEFEEQTLEVEGRCYTYELCDRGRVRVGRLRNRRKKESRSFGPQFLWMREVRVLRGDGRQTSILTNRTDLPAAAVPYRAFNRWRQENYFKYASEEFALDALVEYAVQDVSSEADRPNPERKRVQKELSKARAEASRLREELGAAAKSSRTRTMRGFKISQARLRRELESAEAKVQSLKAEHAKLPARVPASELKTLTTEKKLIVDTIKMTAYQVETQLLGMLQGHYARSHQEGRTLLHALFQTAGRVELGDQQLLITLNRQSSAHRTCAISSLCEELNQFTFCFPGTNLQLQFAVGDR